MKKLSILKKILFINFYNNNNYVANEEQYVTDSPNSVYTNPVNQKVRIVNNFITGSVLSPFIRMEDETEIFVTKDTHFVDASFSPQNEINKDIIAQYGSNINLDELIGDPREMYNDEYESLESLKELTATAIGGRGAFPNGPDVLAINIYKTAGTAVNANIILRWSEAQA